MDERKKGTIKFQKLSEEWLRRKSITVKESTYVKYCNSLSKHILPFWGSKVISEINNNLLIVFIEEKQKLLSNKSLKDLLLIFNSIIKYGNLNYPGEIPPIEIIYPKQLRKEIRILSYSEQEALESLLYENMDVVKLGILVCLYTGLRIGEICALRWEDIYLEEEMIIVRKTVQRLQNFQVDAAAKTCLIISEPKTINSIRQIPIPNFLFPILAEFRPSNHSDFLLTQNPDKCMEPRTLENHFNALLAQLGEYKTSFPSYTQSRITFHSLRHTFATRCVESGFEIKCLSEILGHANVNITLNRYVHSSMKMKRDNMGKITGIHAHH